MLGLQEWIVILIIAFLLFGPKKLPELAKSLGNSVREFKKSMAGDEEPPVEAPKGKVN